MGIWPNIQRIDSSNKSVSKFVFKKDDAVVESVLYKYPTYEERTVICCSTQSGCPMGCRFCGTGDYFVRNLTGDEIYLQPHHLLQNEIDGVNPKDIQKLQIMFMSMGEPMLNYLNLSEAIDNLYDLYPHADLLISTSAPRNYGAFIDLARLSVDIPTIGLQFSIHESTDAARDLLIPAQTLTLEEIAREGEEWHRKCGRKPFFNYCVHDRNNTPEDVERLYRLFDPEIWEATLSVICEQDEHVAAANKRQEELVKNFMNMMLLKGYSVRMFNPAGQDDIGGGCGQLWFVQDWMRKNPDKAKRSAGYGKEKRHTPK